MATLVNDAKSRIRGPFRPYTPPDSFTYPHSYPSSMDRFYRTSIVDTDNYSTATVSALRAPKGSQIYNAATLFEKK